MTTIYKLTDANDQTQNETQWGAGVSHEVTGEGNLCSKGWLHAYTHPLLAVLLNSVHASFVNPHLWLADGEGAFKDDRGLKVGYSKITTIEQMELPVVSQTQRVAFVILCALEVYRKPEFIKWANAWLDGSNRSLNAAYAAVHAAHADRILHASTVRAGYAVAVAAYAATYAATYADDAHDAAHDDAHYVAPAVTCAVTCAAHDDDAHYVAHYVTCAVHAAHANIDLVALVEKAMTY